MGHTSAVGVAVGTLGVEVAVLVGMGVEVGMGVLVGMGVKVGSGVTVLVLVRVGVAVEVEVGTGVPACLVNISIKPGVTVPGQPHCV
jgi:hypothetical protein